MAVSAAMNFGVQSYCFRDIKDNRHVAKLVRQIGVSSVELCEVHASFDKPNEFTEVVKIYQDAGVQIVSLGVQTFVGAEKERNWFECLKIAGARHISAHFKVENFATVVPQVARLAQEYDVKVGIHCHGGYMFGGQPDVIRHLLDLGGQRIGVNIDTAWCMQIGPNQGQPVKWVRELFKGRIYGVHYKDFVFDRRGQWEDVIVGEGNLDLPEFVKALDETGFDGMAVIEYEGDPVNPVPALTQCVNKMRNLAR